MGVVRVCVPFRSDDPLRLRNWRYAESRWQEWGFDVRVGDRPGEEFKVGASRNDAARGEWDAAVFADADIVPAGPEQVYQAVGRAAKTDDAYVACYDDMYWLDDQNAELFTTGKAFVPYTGMSGIWIGCFAISRPLWDTIGGFDERFAGTAGEDVGFIHAAQTLGTMTRVKGVCYHLGRVNPSHSFGWLGPEGTGPGDWDRAVGDREKMLKVAEEAKQWRT